MPSNNEEEYNKYFLDQAAQLPFPLAEVLNLFSRTDEPASKFRNLIRVGATYIKWLSLISIANYIQNNLQNDRINEILGGQEFSRPSLGHFFGLLTAILPLFKEFPERFKPTGLLMLLLKPNGRRQPILNDLEKTFLKLRNLYAHADITPSNDQAEFLLGKYISNLYSLVRTFEIFSEGDLFLKRDDQTFYSIMGYETHSFKLHSSGLGDGEICVYNHKREHLPLYPFVHRGEPEPNVNKDEWSIFLYESLLKKYAKFSNSSNFLIDENMADSLERLKINFNATKEQKLKEQKLILQEALIGSIDWKILRNYSEEKSLDLVHQHRRSLKYHQDLYYQREKEEVLLTDFFSANEVCMFVVSQSGSGKTNLFCHLTRQRLMAGDIVVHFYCRNFEGQTVERLLEESLDLPPGRFDSFFKTLGELEEIQRGKHFVIFFDAINEYQNPLELFRKILDFTRARCFPWLKVIVSCRPLAWKQIEAQVSWDDVPVFTVKQPDGTLQAYLDLKPFSETEVKEAYNLYKNAKDAKNRFGIIIRDDFEDISDQVQQLIRNPVLLRFFSMSYEKAPLNLFAQEILWKYYQHLIPEKHRSFISLFIDLLWECKTDFLSEEDIIKLVKEGNPRAIEVFEYITQGRVEDILDGYKCSNSGCAASDWFLDPVLLDGDRCPECERKSLKETKIKVMNTFDFLIDEGIISENESSSTRLFRFLHDRLFEAMMGQKIYSEVENQKDQVGFMFNLMMREASSIVLHECLKNALLLIAMQDYVGEHDETEKSTLTLSDTFISLCERLIEKGSAQGLNIVENTLVEIGRIKRYAQPLEGFLLNLVSKDLVRKKTGPSLRLALDVTANLGFQNIIMYAIRKGNHETRLLAAINIYRLWRNFPGRSFQLLRELDDKVFFLGLPRTRILEPLGIGSIAIFFDGFKDSATQKHLGEIWKKVIERLKRNPLNGVMVTFLMLKYFSKIPQDYNPANWSEYRDNHRFIRKNKRIRKILSELLPYFDPEHGSMAEFRKLSVELATADEGTTASWSFFLMLSLARYHHYPEEVFETVLEYARVAYRLGKSGHHLATMSTVWAQLSGELALSAGQYQRLKSDEEHRILENMGKCKSIKREYHFSIVLEYMRLVHNNSGAMKIPFVKILVDTLLKRKRTEDLLWIIRNLEVLAIELGTFSETDKWLALFALVDILQMPIPGKVRERCVEVLAKANQFFASDVRRLIETIDDMEQRILLKEEMALVRVRIHVGELISSKPFAYWIHMVKTPGLREHWEEVYSIFLRSYSPLSWGLAVYKHVQKLISKE